MVGGNPQHDAYGFRYWKNPGGFAEYITTGTLGQFEGFLGSLWAASFCIVGPEYISMVAAEAKRPRIYIKQAFKTIYWRFGIFFIGGALCAGIVVSPHLRCSPCNTTPSIPKVILQYSGMPTQSSRQLILLHHE